MEMEKQESKYTWEVESMGNLFVQDSQRHDFQDSGISEIIVWVDRGTIYRGGENWRRSKSSILLYLLGLRCLGDIQMEVLKGVV